MVKIKEIDSIKSDKLDMKTIINKIKEILNSGYQEEAIVVKDNNVIKKHEIYWALKYLGTKFIAVSNEEENVKVSLDFLGFYDEVSDPGIRVYNNTIELIERDRPTPLVKLNGIINDKKIGIWAKLEWYNPFSLSIKDRTAWYIIYNNLDKLSDKEKIFEATSANTGIAIAAISSILGKKTRVFMPETSPDYASKLLKIYGSDVVREGNTTNELIEKVKIYAEKENAFVPNQFSNIFNLLVHLRYTAKEIDYQTIYGKLKLNGIFASMGTGGHIAGLIFYFHNKNKAVKIFGIQPEENGTIPGIKKQDFKNWWNINDSPDDIYSVSLEESIDVLITTARTNGILPGISGGAVLAGLKKAYNNGDLDEGDYVCIIPDNGIKYLDEIYNERVL
ncbi:MAG: pyridoxal-5'-phosphate-dependent protein subunit beta [Caldisphaera sp.]|uniref:PLP-dependent cysteine synthase family protein n=1 Tax=Caldisphaera sp. TaxID=2060322 RepID=UPI000CC96B0A|nr:MAG: pyridoxal-5'-phosphate-dependent protein subunit beta [Caldisphaera sp.]PMP92356.1 MAG: pyridoxal-5'-phosphate-dependent protein subunit beta [Caldisphaera sp.]